MTLGWSTQTDWENAQEADDVEIVGDLFQLAEGIPTAGLEHHYDATELNASDGDLIATWPDLVASADLTGSAEPTYKSSLINGNPGLRYSIDNLTTDFSSTITSPQHIIAVAQFRNPGGGDYEALFDSSSVNHYLRSHGNNYWDYHGVSGSSDDGDPHIFTCLFDGANSTFEIDGAVDATGDAGSNDMTGFSTGALGNGSNNGDWNIGEILVYSEEKTDSEKDTIHSRLGDKWGITV